jgi:UDP-3-O-[3-hydroxymyristoyl] glucosamine N-acyltransferase
VRLRQATTLIELARAHGGELTGGDAPVRGIARVSEAGIGDLAPVTHARFIDEAAKASERGASLLVSSAFEKGRFERARGWVHPHTSWLLAELLDACDVEEREPIVGEGCQIARSVTLGPRVVVGARVTIGAGSVIGAPGFGWATKDGAVRHVPQLGGVVIEDDVHIGPLCTVDAGTLAPTRIRRGAKIDAHCHIGHNCDVGEGSMMAAQTGLAGSVTVGRGVQMGGQVGIADHVTIGDGARIAAKSGVIGDVPPGAVVAGYPALPRMRWLRGLAKVYKKNP